MKKPGRLVVLVLSASLMAGTVPAQHQHHAMSQHKPAAGVKLTLLNDTLARVLTVRLGPLNLPAHADHHAVAEAPDLLATIPFDGWIIAFHPRLVDDKENPLPNRLLHHVAFWNTERPDFLCPQNLEHIFGAGGEMNDWPALPGFGYRVRKGDRILIGTMFHNPTDSSFPKTYLEVRMEYRVLAEGGRQLKNVYPAWFDVEQCGQSGYDLKPGKNVNTGQFHLPYAGTLLGVGGHLHDYGQRLLLENVSRNEEIAALNSTFDPQGHILSMPIVTFLDRGGYRLNQGDVLKVTAFYDNRTGEKLTEGAMGIVVGYFLPDNDHSMALLKRSRGRKGPAP